MSNIKFDTWPQASPQLLSQGEANAPLGFAKGGGGGCKNNQLQVTLFCTQICLFE